MGVTGEAFISDNEVKIKYYKNCYSPVGVWNGKGSNIGHVAYINKIPFIVIRSISDSILIMMLILTMKTLKKYQLIILANWY